MNSTLTTRKMKTPRFLSKIKLAIINSIYSTFKHSECETWKNAIKAAESFEYQYSFGTHICYASSLLNMTAILNPTTKLTVLCSSNKMVGPSNRAYSKHLGTLLKEKRIPEFMFPVIPPSTMLFTSESEEEVGSREIRNTWTKLPRNLRLSSTGRTLGMSRRKSNPTSCISTRQDTGRVGRKS